MFQEYAFEDIIRISIAIIVLFAGFLSIAYIMWWGFLMIISWWKEEKIKSAVNHIRHAVIGIVFLVAILFIFPVVIGLLGLSYGEYLKPTSIFDTIGEISGKMFWTQISSPTIDTTDFTDTNSPSSLPTSFDNL